MWGYCITSINREDYMKEIQNYNDISANTATVMTCMNKTSCLSWKFKAEL